LTESTGAVAPAEWFSGSESFAHPAVHPLAIVPDLGSVLVAGEKLQGQVATSAEISRFGESVRLHGSMSRKTARTRLALAPKLVKLVERLLEIWRGLRADYVNAERILPS